LLYSLRILRGESIPGEGFTVEGEDYLKLEEGNTAKRGNEIFIPNWINFNILYY